MRNIACSATWSFTVSVPFNPDIDPLHRAPIVSAVYFVPPVITGGYTGGDSWLLPVFLQPSLTMWWTQVGLEPTAFCMPCRHSTTELLAHVTHFGSLWSSRMAFYGSDSRGHDSSSVRCFSMVCSFNHRLCPAFLCRLQGTYSPT